MKIVKIENNKRKPLSEKDKWNIARPYIVQIVLLITDYIFKKDEELKDV